MSFAPVPPKSTLLARILVRFAVVLILLGVIFFVPAGTLQYWQAWVYLAILAFPSFTIYLYFLKHDPELVERRLRGGERESRQKWIMYGSAPVFLAIFLLLGFDHRFGWSRVWPGSEPLWLILVSQAVALSGMLMTGWAVNANRYAARTIRVEEGQKVISSGPYRFVRHPMYTGMLLLGLSTPLALGSPILLPPFVLIIPFLAFRLLNEEKLLRAQLPGYTEYCLKTRYRLIPFVW